MSNPVSVGDDLVGRLRENDEMLRDGLQLPGLTEAWHNVVMKQAAKDALEAADRIAELEAALTEAKKRMRNCRGAIESNQVVDKDVAGGLSRGMAAIDAALNPKAPS